MLRRTQPRDPDVPGTRAGWEVVLLMHVLLASAMTRGVPRTLDRLPFLWLPLRNPANDPAGAGLVAFIGFCVDRILGQQPWRWLRFFECRRCLAKGLLMAWYAEKFQFPLRLRFGVRIENGSIQGHCWPENDSLPASECADYHPIWHWDSGRYVQQIGSST